MATNGNAITAPVSAQEVYKLLGVRPRTNGYDIGYICRDSDNKISSGSPRKPIPCPSVLKADEIETYLQANDYGYTTFRDYYKEVGDDTSDYTELLTEAVNDGITDYWGYVKPTSGYYNLSFFDGYYHNAPAVGENDKLYKLKEVYADGCEPGDHVFTDEIPANTSGTTYNWTEDWEMEPGAVFKHSAKFVLSQTAFADDADKWAFVWNGNIQVDIYDWSTGDRENMMVFRFDINSEGYDWGSSWYDDYGNKIYMGSDNSYPYVEISFNGQNFLPYTDRNYTFIYYVDNREHSSWYQKDGADAKSYFDLTIDIYSEGISTVTKDTSNTSTDNLGFYFGGGGSSFSANGWNEIKGKATTSPSVYLAGDAGGERILYCILSGLNKHVLIHPGHYSESGNWAGYILFSSIGLTEDDVSKITGIKCWVLYGLATKILPLGYGDLSAADDYALFCAQMPYHEITY